MKRATIRDVAKAAGVSITTVSKALNNYPDVNEQTKKRIHEVVNELNYVPSAAGRIMGGVSEPVIGLLINDLKEDDPSGSVFGFLSGMCHACKDSGVDFLLLTTDRKAQQATSLKRLCLGKGLSGLVCCGFRLDDPYIHQIRDGEIDLPCACIDINTGNPAVFNVTVDNVRAADEAVTFLIQNGRREIAMFHGAPEVDVSARRVLGFRGAMDRAGLVVRPQRMVNGRFDEMESYLRAKELLAADREIDAVFCASDLMALGVCRAVEDAGLAVGRDIAVIGFDDIPTARYLYGGLTTIQQDFYSMGYTASRKVIEKITGRARSSGDGELLCNLVIRGSAPAGT